MYFKKKFKSTTPSNYTFFLNFKMPITKISIFNFQKMMNMHKGYAYQFSNCIAYKRN